MVPVTIPLLTSSGEHNLTATYQSIAPSVPPAKNTLMVYVINTLLLVFPVASISVVTVIWLVLRTRRKRPGMMKARRTDAGSPITGI